ncbi:MAG: hypothetical protein IJ678_03040, partial [Kiritimatiellae bacterium]|nr:hypothetical protein [Kiritimatiellia bacterium]
MKKATGQIRSGDAPPTVLCFGFETESPGANLALDGIRRYAKGRGWNVETFRDGQAAPEEVRAVLARKRPLGCIVNDFHGDGRYPPGLFGSTPVVTFDSPDPPRRGRGPAVVCDNAAVARAAFAELSAG